MELNVSELSVIITCAKAVPNPDAGSVAEPATFELKYASVKKN